MVSSSTPLQLMLSTTSGLPRLQTFFQRGVCFTRSELMNRAMYHKRSQEYEIKTTQNRTRRRFIRSLGHHILVSGCVVYSHFQRSDMTYQLTLNRGILQSGASSNIGATFFTAVSNLAKQSLCCYRLRALQTYRCRRKSTSRPLPPHLRSTITWDAFESYHPGEEAHCALGIWICLGARVLARL